MLCNRIGIVNDGILRCVGAQIRLKSIYGGGYHLFVNCQKGKMLHLLKKLKRQRQRERRREERDRYGGNREEEEKKEGNTEEGEGEEEDLDD